MGLLPLLQRGQISYHTYPEHHTGLLSGRLGMPQGTSNTLSSPIIIHTGTGNPLSQKTTQAWQVNTGYINANDSVNEIPQSRMLVEIRW